MIDLKREINELAGRVDERPRYDVEDDAAQANNQSRDGEGLAAPAVHVDSLQLPEQDVNL